MTASAPLEPPFDYVIEPPAPREYPLDLKRVIGWMKDVLVWLDDLAKKDDEDDKAKDDDPEV